MKYKNHCCKLLFNKKDDSYSIGLIIDIKHGQWLVPFPNYAPTKKGIRNLFKENVNHYLNGRYLR